EDHIRTAVGASAQDQFIFATSGKEAMQKVFLAVYLDLVRETGRTHLLPYSHTSSPALLERMERLGCLVKPIAMDANGALSCAGLEAQLRARTALVSLPWVDPFTGSIHPVLEIAKLCREREVLLHVDASDALGKFFFRFQDYPIDFLTFDGFSVNATPGTGGLLVRKEKFSKSLALDLENSKSAATIPLADALKRQVEEIDQSVMEMARRRNRFEEKLLAQLSDISILGAENERVAHISAIAFEGVHQEAVLFFLERKKIFASLHNARDDALKFVLTEETSDHEIDRAVDILTSSVQKLRSFSPVLS
ncbi:MAG: aminotransferase class V-fold PLP-dependent enzyme, partial [Chlamydiales bacterium]